MTSEMFCTKKKNSQTNALLALFFMGFVDDKKKYKLAAYLLKRTAEPDVNEPKEAFQVETLTLLVTVKALNSE